MRSIDTSARNRPTHARRRDLVRRLRWIAALLIACLAHGFALAAEPLPRSMLVFNPSDVRGPLYYQIFSALRSSVNASPGSAVTIYVENLDLSRFTGADYEDSLQAHFRVKYRDKPVGVIIAVGSTSLEYVLHWRASLWPGVPVVFAMVDESTIERLKPPPDVTGSIMRLRFDDMMTTARAVVPRLQRVALVGDASSGKSPFDNSCMRSRSPRPTSR
jgi:hypothetical protein